MSELKIGDKAPDFELINQDEVKISLKDFSGKKVILYFYPKDNTPGCSSEACDFSEKVSEFAKKNAVIIGVSKDNSKSHANFIQKYNLKHILLSDISGETLEKYGVWALKKNYGKEYFGIVRSTFIIDENGVILKIYKNVRVKEHAQNVLESL